MGIDIRKYADVHHKKIVRFHNVHTGERGYLRTPPEYWELHRGSIIDLKNTNLKWLVQNTRMMIADFNDKEVTLIHFQ